MKSTGIIRRVDDLGRVVIPKEIRRNLKLKEGDPLELFIEGQAICFKKYDTTGLLASALNEVVEILEDKDTPPTITPEEMALVKSAVNLIKTKVRITDEQPCEEGM